MNFFAIVARPLYISAIQPVLEELVRNQVRVERGEREGMRVARRVEGRHVRERRRTCLVDVPQCFIPRFYLMSEMIGRRRG